MLLESIDSLHQGMDVHLWYLWFSGNKSRCLPQFDTLFGYWNTCPISTPCFPMCRNFILKPLLILSTLFGVEILRFPSPLVRIPLCGLIHTENCIEGLLEVIGFFIHHFNDKRIINPGSNKLRRELIFPQIYEIYFFNLCPSCCSTKSLSEYSRDLL